LPREIGIDCSIKIHYHRPTPFHYYYPPLCSSPQAKGVRDARAMYGALAVLVAVAAYAVASRVLWLFGVALP
jgi:hypothetical protein